MLVLLSLARWVKFLADETLKYFSSFSKKIVFDIAYKLICMKSQSLFAGENQDSISLSSVEIAQIMVKVKLFG